MKLMLLCYIFAKIGDFVLKFDACLACNGVYNASTDAPALVQLYSINPWSCGTDSMQLADWENMLMRAIKSYNCGGTKNTLKVKLHEIYFPWHVFL